MVAGGTILAGLIFFCYGLWGYMQTQDARGWPQADGMVTLSKLHTSRASQIGKKSSSTRYRAEIAYAYNVGGQEYKGYRINVADIATKEGRGRVKVSGGTFGYDTDKDIVKRFPLGKRVKVYYNPSDPSVSALENKLPFHIDLGLWLGLPVAGLGLAAFFWLKRNEAKLKKGKIQNGAA